MICRGRVVTTEGFITIGYGFNIDMGNDATRALVMNEMGITDLAQQDAIKDLFASPTLATIRAMPHATPSERTVQNQALDALFAYTVNRTTFAMTDLQMRMVFDELADEKDLQAQSFTNVETPSFERAVLTSLNYNSKFPPGDPGTKELIGPSLIYALNDIPNPAEARAEAWYEIRYNSGNQYKRRYVESAVFGLYGDIPNITEDIARGIYRMYTRHSKENPPLITMKAYDALHGSQIAQANLDIEAAGIVLQADTLERSLQPAASFLINQYGEGRNFSPLNIWVAADTGGTLIGNSNQAELIIGGQGKDSLFGGSGNDVLVGLGGTDTLYGGLGEDRMVGGAAYDTYIAEGGDTILDSDGLGRVIFDGSQLVGGRRDSGDPAGQYRSEDGRLTYTLTGSTLTVSTVGQTANLTIENFSQNANDLDIALKETVGPAIIGTAQNDYLEFERTTTGSVRVVVNQGGIAGVPENEPFVDYPGDTRTVYGEGGNDTLWVRDIRGLENIELHGGTGDDSLLGDFFELNGYRFNGLPLPTDTAGAYLYGESGDDELYGTLRQDLLDGGADHDMLNGDLGDDVVNGGTGHDLVEGDGGIDIVLGGAGIDILLGGAQADFIFGGDDHDRLYGDSGIGVPVNWIGNTQTIEIRTNNSTEVRDLYLFKDVPVNIAGDDALYGGGGEDRLYGGGGNDNLDGGSENDTLQGEAGDDILQGGSGSDLLFGDKSDQSVVGDNAIVYEVDHPLGGHDTVRLRKHEDAADVAGNDILEGGTGNDRLEGGGGDDTYRFFVGDGLDIVNDISGDLDKIVFGPGISPGDLEYTMAYPGNLVITNKLSVNDKIIIEGWSAGAGKKIESFHFDDGTSWSGNELVEKIGIFITELNTVTSDTRSADSYYYVPEQLKVSDFQLSIHDVGGNVDTLFLGGNYLVSQPPSGLPSFQADGNDLIVSVSYLPINVGEPNTTGTIRLTNALSGPGEIEKIIVGSNQIYTGQGLLAEPRTYTQEFALWRTVGTTQLYLADTVGSTMIRTGTAGADLLQVSNGDGDTTLYGLDGNDELVGSSNTSDTFQGGAGNDEMRGGAKNDHYHIDPNDADSLLDKGTADTQVSNDVLYLPPGVALSSVTFARDGEDLLIGNTRIRRYFYLDPAPTGPNLQPYMIEELRTDDGPVDLPAYLLYLGLLGPIDGTAGNDVMTGDSTANYLRGLAGNDTINGGRGEDLIEGGSGNDILAGNQGNDTFLFNLGDGADTLPAVSSSTDSGTDILQFSAGIQVADIQVSRSGNDLILAHINGVDRVTLSAWFSNTDKAVELVEFDDDTTWSTNDLIAMARTIVGTSGNDNLTGTSSADTLYGLAGNDTLTGGAGDDTLDGGLGTDTMVGGTGNDLYYVDATTDVVTENSGEGTDTVMSTATLTLAANVENLTLLGTAAINGTGNTLANTLVGNSADNTLSSGTGIDRIEGREGHDTLDGGGGADTLIGGTGDDAYVIDNTGDLAIENANEGVDVVRTTLSYTLGANLENLTLTGTAVTNGTGNELNNVLTGNSANNTLVGNAGDDTLDGGSGSDTLRGGVGDDSYVVNVSTDVITENANEGTDTVRSSITLTLGANLENLTVTGSSALNGTGNTLNNVLTGNSAANILTGNAGDDILDGGSGSDTLRGGTGHDTYVVNVSTDVITENANEGTDTVNSTVTLTLGTNLENLTLTGTAAVNGTGNTVANSLLGNNANNTLNASDGDDTLQGEGGNDTLDGGAGNDRYVFGRTDGQDRVTQNDSASTADALAFESGIAANQLWFAHTGNDLVVSVIGTTDNITVTDWYIASANRVDRLQTAAGAILLEAQVEQLVSAMAGMVPPGAGQLDLSPEQQTQLAPTLAASWQGDVAA